MKKTSQITRIVGHIHDALTKVVDGMMPEWKDLQIIDKVDVKNRVPPGTEIPYIYSLKGANIHKSNISEKIKQYKNDLIF